MKLNPMMGRLLHDLSSVSNIGIVVPTSKKIDYPFGSEYEIPSIPLESIAVIINATRYHFFTQEHNINGITPTKTKEEISIIKQNVPEIKNIPDFPWESACKVFVSIRELKFFIRDVLLSWETMLGKVHFDEFFICKVLKKYNKSIWDQMSNYDCLSDCNINDPIVYWLLNEDRPKSICNNIVYWNCIKKEIQNK